MMQWNKGCLQQGVMGDDHIRSGGLWWGKQQLVENTNEINMQIEKEKQQQEQQLLQSEAQTERWRD